MIGNYGAWTVGPLTGPSNFQLDQMGCIPWTKSSWTNYVLPVGLVNDYKSLDWCRSSSSY